MPTKSKPPTVTERMQAPELRATVGRQSLEIETLTRNLRLTGQALIGQGAVIEDLKRRLILLELRVSTERADDIEAFHTIAERLDGLQARIGNWELGQAVTDEQIKEILHIVTTRLPNPDAWRDDT